MSFGLGTRDTRRNYFLNYFFIGCRITPCDVEYDNPSSNSQEVFTSRASLEVEPVDSQIGFDLVEKAVNGNGMESVQLSEDYPSVQCIVGGDGARLADTSSQVSLHFFRLA